MQDGRSPTPHRPQAGPAGRFIVLAGAVEPSRGLIHALDRRGADVLVRTAAVDVMVELARTAAAALLVVDPDRQPMTGELVEAVHTYYPRVDCWQFTPQQEGNAPRISRINGQWASEPRRDTDASRRLESLVIHVDGGSALDGPLISEQELAMLLGPAPDHGAESDT